MGKEESIVELLKINIDTEEGIYKRTSDKISVDDKWGKHFLNPNEIWYYLPQGTYTIVETKDVSIGYLRWVQKITKEELVDLLINYYRKTQEKAHLMKRGLLTKVDIRLDDMDCCNRKVLTKSILSTSLKGMYDDDTLHGIVTYLKNKV